MQSRSIRIPALAAAFAAMLALALAGCRPPRAGAVTGLTLEVEVVEMGTGRPCPGVIVEAWEGARRLLEAPAGESGKALIPGEVTDRPSVVLRARDPSGRLLPAELELLAGGERRLELPLAVPASIEAVGADGEAIPRVDVTVWPAGRPPLRFSVSAGDPRLGPLPAGAAKVLITAPGRAAAILDLTIRPPRKGTVAQLGRVRLLPGGATLRGRLEPPPGDRRLEVILRHGGIGQLARVEPDGSFEAGGLPEGRAILAVREDGKEIHARTVELMGSGVDVGLIRLEG